MEGYGVRYEPSVPGWVVDHGYFGSFWHDKDGLVNGVGTIASADDFAESLPARPPRDGECFWTVEALPTRDLADSVWAARKRINELLQRTGWALRPVRLAITSKGPAFMVYEHDFGRPVGLVKA